MAGDVVILRFVARLNCVVVRQGSATQSATTHTIYRSDSPQPTPKPSYPFPQKNPTPYPTNF